MKSHLPILLPFLLLAAVPAGASSSEVFDSIMEPYEKARLILVDDSIAGVAALAEAVREAADVSSETHTEVRALLPKIMSFADDLAAAEDLDTAREAFYELSKVLVRYRSKLTGTDLPLVMYCPMAEKSWLQVEEKVGNPYQGESMETCGKVVGE